MPKKEFTSFDVTAAVRELKEAILDSRVNNIHQLDARTLLFKLHKMDKPALRLVLEAGRRLNLTGYVLEKPSVPPAFCMALRKFLRNAWLTNIEQHEFERVVVFSFRTKTGMLRLVLELFGDGNIVLVDESNRIMQALVYKRMRDRNVLRGESFSFAPSAGKNPLKISGEEWHAGLTSLGDVEVVRAVARFLSIGGTYAEEVLLRTSVDKSRKCSSLSEGEINRIFDVLQSLLSQAAGGVLESCIVLDDTGGLVDVIPLKLERYEGDGFKSQSYNSFNEALDEFYIRIVATEKAVANAEVGKLKREAERLKRIILDQEKVLAETQSKTEKDRQIGDVIYAHGGELQALLDCFPVGKQGGKEWKALASEVLAEKQAGLKPNVFFESLDSKNLMVNVCVDGLAFGLDLRKTVFENAAEFYERGKRAKQKSAGARVALDDSLAKLAETEAKIREAETLEQRAPSEAAEKLVKLRVRSKEWFEKFRWFVSSDGFLVVAGKDAVSNEVLIKKYTEEDDVVFHADVVGAPFVVVKTKAKKPSEQCLREAGEFAASFSRGWREGFGSVDVYYVRPEQLGKGAPSGESVPHGAFVMRGERSWMRGVPLKLAVGVIVEEGGSVRFVGGPVSAVKAKTNAYVTIVPGDLSGKEVLKHVIRALGGRTSAEMRDRVFHASIEEIREYIPYNVGRVLES